MNNVVYLENEAPTYESGADYVLYKVSKELSIDSKEIRINNSDVKTKAEQLAQLIVNTFCGINEALTLNQLAKMQGSYVCVKDNDKGRISWGMVYSDRIETPEEIFWFRDYIGWKAFAHELRVI